MEAIVFVLLLRRRVFAALPIFCVYMLWTLVSDIAGLTIARSYHGHYFQFYLVEVPVDAFIQFGVLIELAWAVLSPVRKSLPRRSLGFIAGFIFIAGAVVWTFAGSTELGKLTLQWHLLVRLQETISILRVLAFLVIAGGSQVLALGWRNRELQIATGLGFYSLMSLGASMLHAHQSAAAPYHHVDQLVGASYLCSLIYWAVSFAQQEATRQEFSPRMQSFLLSVAGTARANRMAIMDADRNRRDNDLR
jgi:hypothetical protein